MISNRFLIVLIFLKLFLISNAVLGQNKTHLQQYEDPDVSHIDTNIVISNNFFQKGTPPNNFPVASQYKSKSNYITAVQAYINTSPNEVRKSTAVNYGFSYPDEDYSDEELRRIDKLKRKEPLSEQEVIIRKEKKKKD